MKELWVNALINNNKKNILCFLCLLTTFILLFEKVALKSSEVEVQPKLNGGTDVNYVFEYALKETFSKKRLEKLSNDFSSQFQSNTPFPHVYIDNFVDPKLLKLIEQEVVEANYEGGGRSRDIEMTGNKGRRKKN